MNVLSLFAGIGGLDLGLARHGCQTVAYSEVDEYACDVMALRFPDARNYGDVTKIDWSELGERERIDIICAGFPCQDISLQGRGGGLDGERSGLFRHVAEAVRVIRPRGVLLENVAALTQRGLDRVLWALADCGYDAEWECVPASALGAPHRRDRIFIVAYPVGVRLPRPWQLESPVDPASSPYREASDVVDAVRERALPYVCRRHDGLPRGLEREARLKALGNAVVPQVAELAAGVLLERMSEAGVTW